RQGFFHGVYDLLVEQVRHRFVVRQVRQGLDLGVRWHGDLPMSAKMNLPDLIAKYGSEDRCRAYLEALRWPDGPVCPRCGSTKIGRMDERKQFACSSCRYHFSVRAGTIFQDSKLPLTKWFPAIYIIGESKKGVSAAQLSRMLGVTTKTGWFLCHRIRAAMADPL